jgi:hypothetical protein
MYRALLTNPVQTPIFLGAVKPNESAPVRGHLVIKTQISYKVKRHRAS